MRLFCLKGRTDPNISPTTEIELDMETDGYPYAIEVLRIMVKHVGGDTSGHFHFRMGNVPGFSADSIDQMFVDGTVAKSNLMDISLPNSTTSSGFCKTSNNGKMYVRFEPSAGTDNQFDYFIVFRR